MQQTARLPASNRKQSLYLGLLCLLCALFAALAGWLPHLFLSQITVYFWHYTISLVIMLVALVVGTSWIRSSTSHTIWQHPPFLITLWTICYMWILGFYPFYDTLRNVWLIGLFSNKPEAMISGVYIFPVGIVVFWLVYIFVYQLLNSSPRWIVAIGEKSISPTAIWMIYAVSLGAQLFKITITGIAIESDRAALGGFSAFWQWLTYAEDLHYLVIVLLIGEVVRGRGSRISLMAVLAIQLGFGFLSGFMKPVIWIGAVVILTLMANGVKIRQYVIAGVPLVLMAIISVPIAEGIRDQIGRFDARNIGEVVDAAVSAYDDSWGASAEDGFERVQQKLLGRQIGIAHTPTLIYVQTPARFDFQGFRKFVEIPFNIIPRALWPSKPVLVSGNWFYVNYLNGPEGNGTSAAITFFGEGYMFSGWIGVVTTGVMLGIALAILQRWLILANLSAIYFALIPAFIDSEGQASLLITGLIQRVVFILVIYSIIVAISSPNKGLKKSR